MGLLKYVSLSIIAVLTWHQIFFAQEKERNTIWLNRAQQVTSHIISDAPRLSKPERALTLARLADVWWRDDQERARDWYKHAVGLVEPLPGETASETQCRLAVARTLLSILSRRDAELNKRLLDIISNPKQNQDPSDRAENATALVSVALAIVNTDPESAEALAESSLRLAPSIRLGQLLWRLRAASPAAGDKLFSKIREVALATSEVNLFSILFGAVTQGPFTANQYKTQVLTSVAELLARTREPAESPPCPIILLVAPLFSSADVLVPAHAQKLKQSYTFCRTSLNAKQSSASEDNVDSSSLDELLKAADKAGSPAERARYLSKAVQVTADAKNFNQALVILDSMNDEIRTILGSTWQSLRWDYAASAACASRKIDDLQATQKIIDDTPLLVRAPVRIALVLNCDSFSSSEITQLLNSARSELPKTEPAEQFVWFLSLVRLHGKYLPDSGPAVLVEAVNALNRAPKDNSDFCASPITHPTVLTAQLMLGQYTLPATLWDFDESGLLSAVGLVEPLDKKAALRLNLITVALTEHRKLETTKNRKAALKP